MPKSHVSYPEVIEYGDTVTASDWELREDKPTGYSRIYYVLEADAYYEDEYESVLLKPGHLYFLPTSIPYRAWRRLKGSFSCVYLHVLFFSFNVSRLTEIPVEPDSALMLYLKTLQKSMHEERLDMLYTLSGAMTDLIKDRPEVVPTTSMMTQVLEYINMHMHEDITVEQLSHLTDYHPNYFIRLFREESGLPPHQFILKTRLQRARMLLRHNMSVAEVAQEVGYSDAASFARVFRMYYGITPRQYAKGDNIIP